MIQTRDMRPETRDRAVQIARDKSSYNIWGRMSHVSCLMSIVCGLLFTSGCVHRSLTIRTEPPGASVYVNDDLKGLSPITYDFLWYGWYRVTLRKDGYQRLDDHKELRSPPYLWIPFDLAAELLPLPIRDAQAWSYTLTPAPVLPTPTPPPTTESSHAAR